MITIPRSKPGFTIVELLIVIVVIAILAAITVVAYNGITRRANNTARIQNAGAAMKLLAGYIAANSQYPGLSSSCIGNGFADNNTLCYGIDTATPTYRNATFNTELATIGSLPNNATGPVQMSTYKALGPVFSYGASTRTVDGVANRGLMLYFLDGINQDCGLGGVVRQGATDVWTSYTASPRNSGNSGSGTVCWVAVPGL